MSQQYSLRWNNHQPNFRSMFTTLLNTQTLVDVTLAAEGKHLQAHKIVLSACSTYFQALFVNNPSQHPIVILKDVRFADLLTMVDFMYCGEVNVTEEQLPQVLDTAKQLKIKGLTEMPEMTSLTPSQSSDLQSQGDSLDSHRHSASPAASPNANRNRYQIRRTSSTGSTSLNMMDERREEQQEPAWESEMLNSLPQRRLEYEDAYQSRILEDASLMCNSWSPRHNGDLFGGLNDGLLSRAEALAAVDISKHQSGPQPGPLPQLKHDMVYHHGVGGPPPHNARPHQMGHHGMESLDMLDPLSSSSMTTLAPMGEVAPPHHQLHGYGMNHVMNHHHHAGSLGHAPPAHLAHPSAALHPDTDTDPRELEAFAERFKQRRIKLGVTQADVGKALANLKLPGVGALSQSTICRFESLTLSHNNMIALKPILQAWLEEAEAQAKNKRRDPDAPSVLPAGEKKRKRTSIAAPEKRSLEAYFAVQPRPSGEKIAAIAEKLDLKKNVVRVWFCNQRQKQKRMKFAAQH